MSSPRLRLPIPGREQAATGNGAPPQVRLRDQPASTPGAGTSTPSGSGGRSLRGRRLLQPLPLVGMLLVLVALIGFLAVYSSATKRTPVLVAAHALPAGTVLSTDDLRMSEIAASASVLSTLVPEQELSQTVGHRIASAIPAGAPVPAGALAGAGKAQSAALFTLQIPESQVIGATIQAGDRITLLATFGAGSGAASTKPVARGLQVMAVGEAGPNTDPSTATVPVTVAITEPGVTSQLALANEDAKLDVLVEGSGGASTSPIPSVNQGSAP